MGYHQFTTRERYLIAKHKSMGLSVRQMGQVSCRSASTISRELRRNADKRDGRYRVEKADALALPFDAASFDVVCCQFGAPVSCTSRSRHSRR